MTDTNPKSELDPLTLAFVVCGAVHHEDFANQSKSHENGQIGLMNELVQAAKKMEEVLRQVYTKDAFKHLVYSYDVSDPFGTYWMDIRVTEPSRLDSDAYILEFLDSVRRGVPIQV